VLVVTLLRVPSLLKLRVSYPDSSKFFISA